MPAGAAQSLVTGPFVSANHLPPAAGGGLCIRSLLAAVTHIRDLARCSQDEEHWSSLWHRGLGDAAKGPDEGCPSGSHISLVAPVIHLLGTRLRPSKLVPLMALQGGAGQ